MKSPKELAVVDCTFKDCQVKVRDLTPNMGQLTGHY